MELRSRFLHKFEVQNPQFSRLRAKLSKKEKGKNDVVALFDNRDTFPASHYRCKKLEVHCNDDQKDHQPLSMIESSKVHELSFNQLQLTDQACSGSQWRNFGRFVACEAMMDEEYWTAAWLRAEAHWESVYYMRHVDNFKRKYAEQTVIGTELLFSAARLMALKLKERSKPGSLERGGFADSNTVFSHGKLQEFYSMKQRCSGQDGNSLKCFCLIAVRKEDKTVRRTVLNSVLGTLDLSIRQFVQGETYPGEVKRVSPVLASQRPNDAHKYAYVANLCVAKFARRQGIATNLLYLAIDMAISIDMKQLFVHVNADNKPAQELYTKTGFKFVESASFPWQNNQRLLMSMELQ